MSQYCQRCKELHTENEMCPYYLKQLKNHPEILTEAANFANIAGQYHLITSQTLDKVTQVVNKLSGTHLNYEGTHQYVRDVQVFDQLNVDAFSKSGVFANAENAKTYINNATEGQQKLIMKKLNGTGQEVDWARFKEGKLKSLLEKSKLLGEETTNAPGVDGVTINRFTGEEISRTTIKASESSQGLGTNVNDVLKALKSGTLDPDDILVGVDGTEDALNKALERNIERAITNGDLDYANRLKQAQEHLKVEEINNFENIKQSTNRLENKIIEGQAHSTITLDQVTKKAVQGAVIGAIVGLTISGVTNYIKYKKGEISEQEAFQAIGQDTLKNSLIGGSLSTATIFLPAGTIGFIAGVTIGIYLNKSLTNILDEVFGKGTYAEILHASGFVCGMAISLEDCIKEIATDETNVTSNIRKVRKNTNTIVENFNKFDIIMKGDF